MLLIGLQQKTMHYSFRQSKLQITAKGFLKMYGLVQKTQLVAGSQYNLQHVIIPIRPCQSLEMSFPQVKLPEHGFLCPRVLGSSCTSQPVLCNPSSSPCSHGAPLGPVLSAGPSRAQTHPSFLQERCACKCSWADQPAASTNRAESCACSSLGGEMSHTCPLLSH